MANIIKVLYRRKFHVDLAFVRELLFDDEKPTAMETYFDGKLWGTDMVPNRT